MPWGPSDSIQDAVALTAGTATIRTTRSVFVGGSGSPVFTMASGNSVTFSNVPNGTWLPIQITAFTAAGGTTGVLALY